MNDGLTHLGLNSAQVPFILLACQNGPLPQNRMGEILGMDKSTVAKTVAKLVAQGYLQRRHSGEDGRILEVSPTQQAFLVQKELEEKRQEWAQQVTAGMSEVEVAILFDLVQRMEHNVRRAFAPAPCAAQPPEEHPPGMQPAGG